VLVVTEGAINGLAVERALDACPEFDTVVPPFASLRGSNLLPGQMASLSTFRRILVASDPDGAGDKLYRTIKSELGKWSYVCRVQIPSGCDCAEMTQSDLMEVLCVQAYNCNR
jgi:hypothetical protein